MVPYTKGGKGMVEAVLFDMDGLLLDSERVYAEGVYACAEALGVHIAPDVLAATIGANEALTDEIFARSDPAYDGPRMRQALIEWMHREGYDEAMPLKPYAAEILRHLKARGMRCALVTSTARPLAEAHMRAAGIWDCFDAVVTGDLGLPSKPAPDVFLRAAALLGVDIRRCAVLEDSHNGLRAGRAAGAATVMVPDMVPYDASIAPCCAYVARDLREAEGYLCR